MKDSIRMNHIDRREVRERERGGREEGERDGKGRLIFIYLRSLGWKVNAANGLDGKLLTCYI